MTLAQRSVGFSTTVPFADLLSEPLRNGVYKTKEHRGRGVKMVNMGELFAFDFISNQEMKRIELTGRELDKETLKDGDLLFARRSLVLEGSGKCSLVVKPPEPITFESSMIRARLKRDVADPLFFFYFFKSPAGRALMASIATRTAVSGIRGSNLATLRVPLPPLPTQRKTASILSAYDDLIENNTRRIRILEEMAQSIHREWFVNFRFPGYKSRPLVNSESGPIPQGWAVTPFSTVAEFINGHAFKPSDWEQIGRPIIKIRELKEGVTAATPRSTRTDLKDRYIVRNGDLLFSWSADLEVYLWRHGEGLLNQHLFNVVPRDQIPVSFVYYSLRHQMPEFRAKSLGTTMQHIKRSALTQVKCVLPDVETRNRFDQFVSPTLQELQNLHAANSNLRQTRDLLLPRLVSGEVDVSELDIRVPEASA